MNRLEDQIKAIGSSFYKNVLLLTQMLSPSLEFRQHFKQGMFDRPNTIGFLHVSHYLSNVYDATIFKQMVRWPILCKKDEATYRIEMRNFFSVLSRDNPDVNFPPVLMSHLIQSGGTKFLIIMWKLSQVALRAYIKREFQEELWDAPCTSPMDDLIVAYLNNVTAKKYSVMTETHKETQSILDTAIIFLNNEIEISSACKSEIFDRKENVERLVLNTVHPLNQARLMDIEDSNIISCQGWERGILEKVQYLHKKNKELKELAESCACLCKLVLRINTNSEMLDVNKFPKINSKNFLLEHTINNLYTDGSVISFFALVSLLYLTFVQMLYHTSAADFSDLSSCLLFIQNVCKEMKSLEMLFLALNTRINAIYRDEQRDSRESQNVYTDSDMISKVLLITNCKILLQSPKINFNLNECADNRFYEKLYSSLKEKGKPKDLFKRYTGKYRPSHELSGVLSDFSSSWSSINGWLSPRAYSTRCNQVSSNEKPLSPLYSRLLRRTKSNLKRSRENISYSSSTSYEALNLTPRKRRSLSGPARDIFNSAVTSSSPCGSSDSENWQNANIRRK